MHHQEIAQILRDTRQNPKVDNGLTSTFQQQAQQDVVAQRFGTRTPERGTLEYIEYAKGMDGRPVNPNLRTGTSRQTGTLTQTEAQRRQRRRSARPTLDSRLDRQSRPQQPRTQAPTSRQAPQPSFEFNELVSLRRELQLCKNANKALAAENTNLNNTVQELTQQNEAAVQSQVYLAVSLLKVVADVLPRLYRLKQAYHMMSNEQRQEVGNAQLTRGDHSTILRHTLTDSDKVIMDASPQAKKQWVASWLPRKAERAVSAISSILRLLNTSSSMHQQPQGRMPGRANPKR